MLKPVPNPRKRITRSNKRNMRNNAGSTNLNHRIVISLGDPAGIGMEVTLKALASPELPVDLHPVIFGCKKTLENVYHQLKKQTSEPLADPIKLDIQDLPLQGSITTGKPTPETGEASFHWLSKATEYVLNGNAKALVTAPIAKHAWHNAGHKYPGQTEFLGEVAKTDQASMLFTAISPKSSWRLNTLLATTHIPLIEVPKRLNPELIYNKLTIFADFLLQFSSHPCIAIAGLNPHAGEKGSLGKEEIEWLIPLLEKWQKMNPNFLIQGPISPDICWLSAAKAWQKGPQPNTPDGILALYHDQGLIPIKILAFDQAVNTTLGLPFLRTSPDHGTGFDIAGKGFANSKSMLAAIKTAWNLSHLKNN